MAMLRLLPREEYTDFVSSLMRQKDLTRANVEAAFQVEQTEHDTNRGSLLSPSGDAARRPTTQAPRMNQPGVKCAFCTGNGHTKEDCYDKELARKDAQKAVEERRAGCDICKKARANRAATASPSLPLLSNGAKITELAASASVGLASSPDTHTEAHFSADTGATSHMSPRRSVLHLVAHHRFRIEIKGKEMVFMQDGEGCFTAAIRDNTAWHNASTTPAPEAATRGSPRPLAPMPLSHLRGPPQACHQGQSRYRPRCRERCAC
jgi:hypothetical protein